MFLRKLISYARYISQFILSNACILCGFRVDTSSHICEACEKDLPSLPDHCLRCAQFLAGSGLSNLTCGSCLKKAPPFDHTFALFPYQNPIISLITQLKFRHELSHAKAFANLFIKEIKTTWYQNKSLPDLIIPIPLHAKRLKERGFNQALEIAKPIAKAFKIPIDKSGMVRIKATAAQSGLSASARKQNIAHAFTVNRDYSSLYLAVLDDVVTTGHTMTEFCKTLKKHGANKIDVWCVARRG